MNVLAIKVRPFITDKRYLLLETGLLIVLPVVILSFWPNLLLLRHILMVAGVLYFGGIFFLTGAQRRYVLGRPLTKQAFKELLTVSALVILGLMLVNAFRLPVFTFPLEMHYPGFDIRWVVWGYVLMSAPLQEVLFRGMLINRLALALQNERMIKLYAAVVFGFIHIPLKNPFVVAATLMAGYYWGHLFIKYRSIWPPILLHALWGGTFIYLGLPYNGW